MGRWQTWIGGSVVMTTLALAPTAHAQCANNSDCRAGRVCAPNGECVEQACSRDVDCPNEGTCEAHVCKPAATSTPPPNSPYTLARPTHHASHGIAGLYISGAVILGVIWMTTVGVTAGVAQDPGRGEAIGYSAIPLIGPWVMMASNIDTHSYTMPLVLSGVLQAGGLTMIILGATLHRGSDRDEARTTPTLTLMPYGNGAALVGTF
jgi:hypothetical protein